MPISLFKSSATNDQVQVYKVVRRISWRLLPFLFLLYLIASIDRSNVAFAALQMNHDLGFNASVYGFGAGIFFIGYCLLEIPSNLVLARVGARRWISRIMISWGIVACAMMLIRGRVSFYSLRFLLGAAEAGFFPQRRETTDRGRRSYPGASNPQSDGSPQQHTSRIHIGFY